MEMTKSKITQIVIGGLSLVMLILSFLAFGIFETGIDQWILAVLIVSFGFSVIEVVVYFVFTNREILEMICKWLVIFFGVIILVINTVALIVGFTTIFTNFLAMTGWLALLFIVLTYVLCAAMIAYIIFSDKEAKVAKIEPEAKPAK